MPRVNTDSITLSVKDAKSLFNQLDAKGKSILTDQYPDLFGNIMDIAKSFDDVLAIMSLSIEDIVSGDDERDVVGYKKVKLIAEVLNEGWEPDWTNANQYKYYPWFDLSSGSGLSYGDFGLGGSGSGVGSRLCYKTRELAEFAGRTFVKEYQEFML